MVMRFDEVLPDINVFLIEYSKQQSKIKVYFLYICFYNLRIFHEFCYQEKIRNKCLLVIATYRLWIWIQISSSTL